MSFDHLFRDDTSFRRVRKRLRKESVTRLSERMELLGKSLWWSRLGE